MTKNNNNCSLMQKRLGRNSFLRSWEVTWVSGGWNGPQKVTKPWWSWDRRQRSWEPQMQQHEFSKILNCFTQSLAWTRWDGKWFSVEAEVKNNCGTPSSRCNWKPLPCHGRLQCPCVLNKHKIWTSCEGKASIYFWVFPADRRPVSQADGFPCFC